MDIKIREFQPSDQAAAEALILAGLEEHWGTLDPTLNPDLNNIAATYAAGAFLVAVAPNGDLIGTGALKPVAAATGEIVRMSVARAWRRRGIGRRMLVALIDVARTRGYTRIILETTATWAGARAFYQAAGFRVTHYAGGDVYFEKAITGTTQRTSSH